MEAIEIELLASKIAEKITAQPRWLKLSAAAKYSGYGMARLRQLASEGVIRGYRDPESTRGDWIFDRESIDEYRLLPCYSGDQKAVDILRSL